MLGLVKTVLTHSLVISCLSVAMVLTGFVPGNLRIANDSTFGISFSTSKSINMTKETESFQRDSLAICTIGVVACGLFNQLTRQMIQFVLSYWRTGWSISAQEKFHETITELLCTCILAPITEESCKYLMYHLLSRYHYYYMSGMGYSRNTIMELGRGIGLWFGTIEALKSVNHEQIIQWIIAQGAHDMGTSYERAVKTLLSNPFKSLNGRALAINICGYLLLWLLNKRIICELHGLTNSILYLYQGSQKGLTYGILIHIAYNSVVLTLTVKQAILLLLRYFFFPGNYQGQVSLFPWVDLSIN